MTEQERWEAVKNSDSNYDGLFFYAVKTTGIFCRPSCKSKIPKKENIIFFETADQARSAGFRPCKRCRSDLLEYDPMHEIAKELKEKLDEAVKRNKNINVTDMGLTLRRLTDIFKQEYGITPKEYTDELRIQTIKDMLLHTDKKKIDIAFETGFTSLTTFNRFFKKKTGITPTQYQKSVNVKR